jgi:WD40 repeat protein
VNTLQLHTDGVHLLSSASDGAVAVFDTRQLVQHSSSSSCSKPKACKPVAAGKHLKSSQGAYWEPKGGKRVLSVSFDDTLRIWELTGGSLAQKVGSTGNGRRTWSRVSLVEGRGVGGREGNTQSINVLL